MWNRFDTSIILPFHAAEPPTGIPDPVGHLDARNYSAGRWARVFWALHLLLDRVRRTPIFRQLVRVLWPHGLYHGNRGRGHKERNHSVPQIRE